MEPRTTRMLPIACAVALGTVLLARVDFALAAAVAAAGTLLALARIAWPAGLAALPAFLSAAALPPEASTPQLPDGPVAVDGVVAATRHDPLAGELEVALAGRAGTRLRLSCPDSVRALPGDRLRATARCTAPSVPGQPPTLHATADACAVTPGDWSLPRACAAARRALEESLLRTCPGEEGALLCTLVLGNGTRLPGDVAAAHRATGLSHLLAVSGAHAAMLAWLLGLQPFGGGPRRRVGRRHLVVAMALLLAYGAIAGLEPPIFRALCSYVLVALGVRSGRKVDAVQGLCWPALFSIVFDPQGVLGASFCLSYAAVAGLALAGGPRGDDRMERWVWAPMRSSFWATAMTAPLSLLWFAQIAPWTVLLTPVLAPVVGALLFCGLGAALIALAVPDAAAWSGPALGWLVRVYAGVVDFADGLPWTPILAPTNPQPLLLWAAGAAGAAVLLARRTRGAALIAVAMASAPHFAPAPPTTEVTMKLFAVGHGQACLFATPAGTVLVDCGSMQHPFLPARKVERALRRRTVDLVVVTHGDRDHTGALAELLRRVAATTVVLPASLRGSAVHELVRANGSSLVELRPGERCAPLPWVEVAAPRPRVPSSNDESLWVHVDLGGTSVLASGDAEEEGVRAALADGIARCADVLVLPHHGRANEAGDDLLAAVRPRACLASCPGRDGLSALGELARRRGCLVIATGIAGDVTVHGGPSAWLEGEAGLPLPTR